MAPVVEIKPSGSWVDITGKLRLESGLEVFRGREAESDVTKSTCTFVLDNRDYRFSSDVPGTTYYRTLGRGTEIRISESGESGYRFWGEIWSLRPASDESGRDVTVTVEAEGLFRRLSNTQKSLRSPLERSISFGSVITPNAAPLAYWPLEDGNTATELEHLGTYSRRGYLGGEVSLAADGDLTGSNSLPNVGTGGFLAGYISPTGLVPTTDNWSVTWLGRIDDIPDAETVIARIGTYGTVATDTVGYEVAMNTSGSLILRGLAGDNLLLDIYTFTNSSAYDVGASLGEMTLFGRWVIFTLANTITAGPVHTLRLTWTDATGDGSTGSIGPTAGATVRYDPRGSWAFYGPPSGNRGFGHLAVWDGLASITSSHTLGWISELAADRIARLCLEEGVTSSVTGGGSEYMGPQIVGSLLDNLEDAAAADGGILSESTDQLGVTYRARTTLYNQIPVATVNIAGSQLHGGLEPIRDDAKGLANVVVATREGGTAQTFTIPDDDPIHLTTEDPPTGIGVVEASTSPNVETDTQASASAAWEAHLRSWREPRYEEVTVCLHAPAYTSSASRTAAIAAVDLGDVVALTNQPGWVPPDPIQLMVQGIREYSTAKTNSSGAIVGIERTITFNCTPAPAWEVWNVDTSGSTVALAATSSATSLTVATSSGPEWVTAPDPPFYVKTTTSGEAMKVTNVSTATPAFLGIGAVAHGNNTSVVPAYPAALTTGALILCAAAIRNSGTGTVDLPSGWTSVAESGNLRVFGRYFVPDNSDDFESGVSGWTNTSCTFVSSSAQAHGGTKSGLMTVTGTPSQAFTRKTYTATAGNNYAAGLWIRSVDGHSDVGIAIDWYDSGLGYLSTSTSGGTAAAAGVWEERKVTATAPASTAFALVGPTLGTSPPTGEQAYVDDVYLTQAPTVTFSNGAASADTSAEMLAFSGLSLHLDYTASAQLNGSAANVAFPALALRAPNTNGRRRAKCVTFIVAWKQDDTTGVTPASGFTEAFENSTTTGNDQSMAVDYRIDTTAAAVTAGTKTWGGGAAAISRALVFALRPVQTFTVTRSVNNVTGSITAGDLLHVWRYGVFPA